MTTEPRLFRLDGRQTQLFEVLEEVRAQDFPGLPAQLAHDLLQIQMRAIPEAPPISETRKRLSQEARQEGDVS